jgi:hypothetical protein
MSRVIIERSDLIEVATGGVQKATLLCIDKSSGRVISLSQQVDDFVLEQLRETTNIYKGEDNRGNIVRAAGRGCRIVAHAELLHQGRQLILAEAHSLVEVPAAAMDVTTDTAPTITLPTIELPKLALPDACSPADLATVAATVASTAAAASAAAAYASACAGATTASAARRPRRPGYGPAEAAMGVAYATSRKRSLQAPPGLGPIGEALAPGPERQQMQRTSTGAAAMGGAAMDRALSLPAQPLPSSSTLPPPPPPHQQQHPLLPSPQHPQLVQQPPMTTHLAPLSPIPSPMQFSPMQYSPGSPDEILASMPRASSLGLTSGLGSGLLLPEISRDLFHLPASFLLPRMPAYSLPAAPFPLPPSPFPLSLPSSPFGTLLPPTLAAAPAWHPAWHLSELPVTPSASPYKTLRTTYYMEAGDPKPVLLAQPDGPPGAPFVSKQSAMARAILAALPPPPPLPGGAGVQLGIVMMTKKPFDLPTWLTYHYVGLGIRRFYLKVEDTPELAPLLATPPWDRCVVTSFDDHTQRDYFAQMDRQAAHIAAVLPRARADGLTHLLHIDDDELLFCPAGIGVLLGELAVAPPSRPDCHLCNIEALMPHDSCSSPFSEATVFRHFPTRYVSYTNGKSIGRLDEPTLRSHGPHHFRNELAAGGNTSPITYPIGPETACVLHYESATYAKWHHKFLELASRHGDDPEVYARVPFAFYRKSMVAASAILAARATADTAAEAIAIAAAHEHWCEHKLAPLGLPPPEPRPRVLSNGLSILSPFLTIGLAHERAS